MPLSETCRLARALAHDVGKYVARTARNVPDGGWTTELASMLASDLYDLRGERALQIFLRLAPADSLYIFPNGRRPTTCFSSSTPWNPMCAQAT